MSLALAFVAGSIFCWTLVPRVLPFPTASALLRLLGMWLLLFAGTSLATRVLIVPPTGLFLPISTRVDHFETGCLFHSFEGLLLLLDRFLLPYGLFCCLKCQLGVHLHLL